MQHAPARYAPARQFPPYAFLPGRDPHPTRDPRGHSHGVAEHAPGYMRAEEWRANEEYLFGVDLYNHGYLWEAHEVWEGLWHAAKHDTDQAQLLQGLIQCSAASLKIAMEQQNGLVKLAALGTGRLEGVAQRNGGSNNGRYMGLDVAAFVRAFRAFAGSQPASADARPRIALG